MYFPLSFLYYSLCLCVLKKPVRRHKSYARITASKVTSATLLLVTVQGENIPSMIPSNNVEPINMLLVILRLQVVQRIAYHMKGVESSVKIVVSRQVAVLIH